MKTIAEYREFAKACRALAAKLTDPNDKRATELMAETWEKIAGEREAFLGIQPSRNTTGAPGET